nr:diaminopimelate epimerase [Corynebacterium halotolerans]
MFFAKGHGTGNDFLVLPDEDATLDLDPGLVAALCDRRTGLGADGVLRVARAGALLDAGGLGALAEGIARDDWFMDYRNADGSIAEMCGNGVRVFAHWIRSRGLVAVDRFTVGTRAGARPVTVHSCDDHLARVSVDMGPAEVTGVSTARMGGLDFAGLGVDLGNPHLAAVVPGLTRDGLAALRLEQPVYDTEFFPRGVNVEVLTELADGSVGMRVFERGVGETLSCGTGTVAAARAALADAGRVDGTVTVEVPGGQVVVEIAGETSTLTGPSRIVATGHVHRGAVTGR